MSTDQVLAAIYVGGIIPVTFGLSVYMRVQAKKNGYGYALDGGPPPLLFGLFWPIFVAVLIVWGVFEVFSHAADYTAERLTGQEETPETLLRASKEPK